MNIDALDKDQLRRGIRAAIAALAGGSVANNAMKARVAQGILGMSPGAAQSEGSMADLRARLTTLVNSCTDNQREEVRAAACAIPAASLDQIGIDEWDAPSPTPSPALPQVASNDPRAAALALLLQGGADETKVKALEGKVDLIGRGLVAVNQAIQALDANAIVTAAADAVKAQVADIDAKMTTAAAQIASLCQVAATSPQVRARVAAQVSRQTSPVLSRLDGLYTPGVAQDPLHVCLLSPPGLGKSFWVRKLAAAYDVFIEHGCSNDSEEVNTLKGGATVRGDGSFLVYDGRITEAVRAAAAGKNTLLFLDEVLRLSDRAQNVLLTFLTGVKKPDGSRVYEWTSKQTDASGASIETIQCPVERLHIIGAGNLNAAPVEAFKDRWELIRVQYDEALVQDTAYAILSSFGIQCHELPRRFALAVSATRALASQGVAKWSLSSRAIERAAIRAHIRGITDENKVGEICAEFVPDSCAGWDARTGDIDLASVGALRGVQDVLNFTTAI